jgi:hypothetical protein
MKSHGNSLSYAKATSILQIYATARWVRIAGNNNTSSHTSLFVFPSLSAHTPACHSPVGSATDPSAEH